MTRTELLHRLSELTGTLGDEALEAVLQFSAYMAGPSYYETLGPDARASIARGISEYERGEVSPYDEVSVRLDARLKNAGA